MNLIIHPPWNETIGVWDLFATTNLNAYASGLNGTNWVWELRTDAWQTNLTIANFSITDQCYFRLGTMLDSDGDGLPRPTNNWPTTPTRTIPIRTVTGYPTRMKFSIIHPLTPNPAIPQVLNIQICPQ